jgi:histidinol phosphatase-like PHP family hydrolase
MLTRREFLKIAGLAGLATFSGGLLDSRNSIKAQSIVDPLLAGYGDLVNLLGDIQVHTNFSDGDNSPDFALRYGRDTSKLDFCCITDHAEIMALDDFRALPYYRTMPAKYDDPGNFCVLFGYEWTGWHFGNAHRCVYSLDSEIPVLASNQPGSYDIADLWNGLAGHDVITVPHCTVMEKRSPWWDPYNPDVERLVEFYSKWGCSLDATSPRPVPNGNIAYTVLNALAAGRHYGLICNSDSHFSRPGSRLQEIRTDALKYSQPGITGVWAASHTREGIYDALKNRRCYGMTGTRVGLMFTVNRAVMGSEIQSQSGAEIGFRVSTDQNITMVSILKIADGNVGSIYASAPNTPETEGTYNDSDLTGEAAYLLKVDLANSDMAVSSPVWVTKVAATPQENLNPGR